MKNKNILPVTEARSKIFSIIAKVQESDDHFLLTREGKPEAVILSAKRFEKILNDATLLPTNYCQPNYSADFVIRDKGEEYYQTGRKMPAGSLLIIRDAGEIIYLSQPNFAKEKKARDLIKAQLYIELVEKYNYPIEFIEIGRYLSIGQIKEACYLEADIIIYDSKGNPQMIFLVAAPDRYEKEKDAAIKNLFNLAQALSYQAKQTKRASFLAYCARICKKGKIQEKIMLIDYQKYDNFEKWQQAGAPTNNKIPQFKK